MRTPFRLAVLAGAIAAPVLLYLAYGASASAQIVVSANDNKAVLIDGVNTVPDSPAPDTVTILDASVSPPSVIAELAVPNSVIGPPQNVAIAPDGSIAVVASAVRLDPTDPKKTVPDDRVTVIDLKSSPPVIVGTATSGAGASGTAFSPDGRLLLVANRVEGTVSVFTVSGKSLTRSATIDLGAPQSGPSQVAFAPNGRIALVTRDNDHLVSVLSVSGTTVEYTKRDIAAGLRPYGMEITPAGDLALVANVGNGLVSNGVDTISLIDLSSEPARAIDHVAVGMIPEALAISPDGRFVAVTVMNGTNLPSSSPLYQDRGLLRVFSLANRTLSPVTETRIGRWCQGVAWTSDSSTVLAQCMTEREIQVFRFDGKTLTSAGAVKVNGAPAGIRAAGR